MNPRDLPIYNHEHELCAAIRDHRVVIVEGPTGSGKTTQLPKIIDAARLSDGRIGVTQPRRIAAVSVAWRIAEELQVALGEDVGYAIRFDDRSSADTRIRLMTDGILLMEARTDDTFSRYGMLVIDEAHERTLNIDFTLGLLHRALRKRPDLRVIVSSATLDPLLFQRFFADIDDGVVPVVKIDARPYPVNMVYRPVEGDDRDAVADAMAEEVRRIASGDQEGHILAFLPGEAAIKACAERVYRFQRKHGLWVLPLYGKLTREEQERVFIPSPDRRKVVISTNIAETSITVPGVRFVVDSGLAKVPRVQRDTGIAVLREEGISQSSADQRAGRAGRTAPGEAIRLYSRRSYNARPRFTDAEITRLDLTDVVLRLITLGIHDVERFPFPTKPKPARLRAAVNTLQAMGAIDNRRHLTAIGKRMVPFPLSPSLSRMVVEAADRFFDVVDEVLMVGASLSSRPPGLFPQGEENEARAAQRGLAHPLGDAVTAVRTLQRYQKANKPEKFCEQNYLDPNIMAFIDKAYRQLKEIATHHGIAVRGGGPPEQVVRCLGAGFASNIMRKQGRVYEGPGDSKVAIHPSSALFHAGTPFVVAAEIVVSHRAYARHVSALRPEWIGELNPDLGRKWRVSAKRKRKDEKRPPTESVPTHLEVGGVELPVEVRRGRPWLTVPTSAQDKLAGIDLSNVPPRTRAWKATLSDGKHRWGRAMALAKLLSLLPLMPLPKDGAKKFGGVPLGAFLDTERNLHTIARFIDRSLEPGLPSKGRHPGWLSFVPNGEGGFWFEVIGDLPDAVLTTREGLKDLLTRLPADDALSVSAAALLAKVETLDEAIGAALAAAKESKRRRG